MGSTKFVSQTYKGDPLSWELGSVGLVEGRIFLFEVIHNSSLKDVLAGENVHIKKPWITQYAEGISTRWIGPYFV